MGGGRKEYKSESVVIDLQTPHDKEAAKKFEKALQTLVDRLGGKITKKS